MKSRKSIKNKLHKISAKYKTTKKSSKIKTKLKKLLKNDCLITIPIKSNLIFPDKFSLQLVLHKV